jgi:hypothetical protein
MSQLRSELPVVPEKMKHLPVDERGYPVPWFVAWLNEDGRELRSGLGKPDFRIMRARARAEAYTQRRCWVCGGHLEVEMAFTAGAMCAVNRTLAEPPSHRECAEFSAKACPFLTRPHAKRREAGMPSETAEQPGHALLRNPGVAAVWICRSYRPFEDGRGGVLFEMGDPVEVLWFREGRPATRAEVARSIETGLPSLEALLPEGEERQQAEAELKGLVDQAMELAPA